MNKDQKTVLIGLSGGVDSAVAALLLKKQGYNVIAAFMKNFSETKNKLTGECNYLQDKKDAQKIAALLKIPFKTLDFESQYKSQVINPMFQSYSKGLTPNPDSLCNKIIKFPLLWKYAKSIKADYIATGHYIKKTKTKIRRNNPKIRSSHKNLDPIPKNKKDYLYNLKIPKDKSKDQSYFLYELTQSDLKHTLFPLHSLSKTEIRAIAKKNKFPNHDKLGSRGICFIGKINMKSFLRQKIKPRPGLILDPQGNTIGSHNGVMYYTIGERIRENENTKIDKEYRNKTKRKLYIANKNTKSNTLTISPEDHITLKKDTFKIIKTNFISLPPSFPLKAKVRIRHLGKLHSATLTLSRSNKITCTLKTPIAGIAEGQSAVIYKSSTILCGGEIRY